MPPPGAVVLSWLTCHMAWRSRQYWNQIRDPPRRLRALLHQNCWDSRLIEACDQTGEVNIAAVKYDYELSWTEAESGHFRKVFSPYRKNIVWSSIWTSESLVHWYSVRPSVLSKWSICLSSAPKSHHILNYLNASKSALNDAAAFLIAIAIFKLDHALSAAFELANSIIPLEILTVSPMQFFSNSSGEPKECARFSKDDLYAAEHSASSTF